MCDFKHATMWQLLALTSAVFSALAAVFEKKALLKLKPLEFSLLLSLFTLILALPFLAWVDLSLIDFKTLAILYGKSILGALAFLLVMHGLKNLEISSSLPLLVLTPGVVAILAFFLLNETLTRYDIFGMLLLLVGTYFLQLKPNGSYLSPFKSVGKNKAYLFLIGAILLFSTTTILDKTLLKTYKLQPEAFLPIQQLFFTINFALIFLLKKNNTKALSTTIHSSWKIILLIACFAIIYRYSHILAIKAGSVALVLSIKRTSVFFATVFGGQYFKEQNIFRKSLATIIMIGGAILLLLA